MARMLGFFTLRLFDVTDKLCPAITGISMRCRTSSRSSGCTASSSEYSAPWSLSFTRPIAQFHIVERGAAWIMVDGASPTRNETGDLTILPLGAGHVLGSDPDSAASAPHPRRGRPPA